MKYKIKKEEEVGAEFKCRGCGFVVVLTMADIIEIGEPYCEHCDDHIPMSKCGIIESRNKEDTTN